jgi:hypothetical protein
MITRWPEQRKNDLSQRHVRKRPVSTEAAFVKSNSAIGRLNSTSALRHGHTSCRRMYGGVIGSVLVTGIVTRHRSPWFRGPYALVFADPRPEPFRPARGQVGLFRVQSP